MIDFDSPLDAFAKTISVNRKTVVRRIANDLMRRIVFRTPVDLGRARSGWDLTVNAPSDHLPPERKRGVSYPPTSTGIAPVTSQIDGTQIVYLINNLPYIERLNEGHSQQMAGKFVELSMAEVEAEIEILMGDIKE